jgi:hypothetical protein
VVSTAGPAGRRFTWRLLWIAVGIDTVATAAMVLLTLPHILDGRVLALLPALVCVGSTVVGVCGAVTAIDGSPRAAPSTAAGDSRPDVARLSARMLAVPPVFFLIALAIDWSGR